MDLFHRVIFSQPNHITDRVQLCNCHLFKLVCHFLQYAFTARLFFHISFKDTLIQMLLLVRVIGQTS